MSRKYTIYEAPIRKMYASDFRLLDNKIVPVYDEEIVQEKGHFYINRFKKIINIEHSTALPDEREIKDLIDFVISHNQVLLYKLLQDPTISYEVKNEYFERIKELIERNIVFEKKTNLIKEKNRLETYFNFKSI